MGCCNLQCFVIDVAATHPDEKVRHRYFRKIIKNQDLEGIKARYLQCKNHQIINLAERTQSDKSRNESVPCTASTVQSLREMLAVHVIILDHGPHQTIRRRRITREALSTCTIKDILQWIASASTISIDKARLFYSKTTNFRHCDLQEIYKDQFRRKKLRGFATCNGVICFVVDFTGQLHASDQSSCAI
uniref:HTH_48 domain-containing protein n=1 Tax=Ascaris lumbricoides TaxID=6252 RepID=A0A0M3IAY1_ASCLU